MVIWKTFQLWSYVKIFTKIIFCLIEGRNKKEKPLQHSLRVSFHMAVTVNQIDKQTSRIYPCIFRRSYSWFTDL